MERSHAHESPPTRFGTAGGRSLAGLAIDANEPPSCEDLAHPSYDRDTGVVEEDVLTSFIVEHVRDVVHDLIGDDRSTPALFIRHFAEATLDLGDAVEVAVHALSRLLLLGGFAVGEPALFPNCLNEPVAEVEVTDDHLVEVARHPRKTQNPHECSEVSQDLIEGTVVAHVAPLVVERRILALQEQDHEVNRSLLKVNSLAQPSQRATSGELW